MKAKPIKPRIVGMADKRQTKIIEAAQRAVAEARKLRQQQAAAKRRMVARHDPALVEWIESLERRIDRLEIDTSPHRNWI